MSVFVLLQWSEAITHSEVPKLRVSAGGWVWGLGVSDAPLKLNWSSGLWNGHLGLRWSCRRRGLALCALPPCEEAPKEQEQQLLELKVPSNFHTRSLAGEWGIVRLVHWNLPVSVPTCDKPSAEWQGSRVPGNGFPTWLLSTSKLNRKHMVVFDSKVRLLFLLSPLLKKAGRRAVVSAGTGRDAADDTLHVHSMLCTDPWAPVPPREVSLLVCVTNWAGEGDPARAAVPASLGTEPAPLEMPPGASFFYLGLSKVEDEPYKSLTCKILLMLSSEPFQEG